MRRPVAVVSQARYRADIDGLRAVAVLSVLLFHLGVAPFSGGYVGVDVFFVISGFLITRLIRDEVIAGTFRFGNFYLRRARRLFPALFVTLVGSFVAAYVLLSPALLERFGGALLHAILSLSNVYFWAEGGYFDVEAHYKPLLHMWSLSVEEQYYLVWPLLLVLLLTRAPRGAAVAALSILGVGSLGLNALYVDQPAAMFYLAPFRVFEFAIGGVLVWADRFRLRANPVDEILLLLGLGLIAYAVFRFTDETLFPWFNALLPSGGAAMAIYAGRARFAGWLLRNRLMVGIGLISYSLYLLHWPLIVFYRYLTFETLTPIVQWVLGGTAVGGAVLMYRFVEQPIRRPHGVRRLSPPAFGLSCALAALVLTLPAASSWANGGWGWRFPDLPANLELSARHLERHQTDTSELARNAETIAPFSEGATKVLVVGDSHANDVFNALYLNRERLADFEFRRLWIGRHCLHFLDDAHPPPAHLTAQHRRSCDAALRVLAGGRNVREADYVVLAMRWDPFILRQLQALQRALARYGAHLVVLGRTAEFPDVPSLVQRHRGALDRLPKIMASYRDTEIDKINTVLRQRLDALGIAYFDRRAQLCDAEATRCWVLSDDHRLLVFDYGHWTLDGARLYGELMLDQGFLRLLQRGAG